MRNEKAERGGEDDGPNLLPMVSLAIQRLDAATPNQPARDYRRDGPNEKADIHEIHYEHGVHLGDGPAAAISNWADRNDG
jgi:hypothetical protein